MKNKIISLLIFAALMLSCAIAFSSCGGGDVPTYEGMKISNNASMANYSNVQDKLALRLEASGGEAAEPPIVEDVPAESEKEPAPDDIVEIEIVGGGIDGERYIVEPGEPFIVEVYLSNPEQFEIQSFTLNGTKYSSYMFEDDSTMELLRLEYIAPDTHGSFELTLDAIKYIDGTEIKDVKMNAERTIHGVILYTEYPTASAGELTVGMSDFTAKLTLSDTQNMIGDDPAYFYIAKDEEIVHKELLTLGENSINVTSLTPGVNYNYGVISVINDPMIGKYPYKTLEGKFTTASGFAFKNAVLDYDSVSFELEKRAEGVSFVSAAIMDAESGAELGKLTDISALMFSSLNSNKKYKLIISYTYKLGEETLTAEMTGELTTKSKPAPTVSFKDIVSDSGSIGFDYDFADPLSLGALGGIELLCGGELIKAAEGLDVRAFDGLSPFTLYTVRISYSYDLSDGRGEISAYQDINIATDMASPVASGFCGDGMRWCLVDSATQLGKYELHILGKGEMSYTSVPWRAYKNYIVKVSLSDGITAIANDAFKDFTSLSDIAIPESVKAVGERAFSSCDNLTALVMPSGLEVIGSQAFDMSERLVVYIRGEEIKDEWFGGWNGNEWSILHYGNCMMAFDSFYTDEGGSVYAIAIDQNSLIYDGEKALRAYLLKYNGDPECAILPETVNGYELHGIWRGAFDGFTDLRFIYLPEPVYTIKPGAISEDIKITLATERSQSSHDFNSVIYFDTRYEVKGTVTDDQGVVYLIGSDGNAAVVGLKGDTREVTIASEINGAPVTEICAMAFGGNKNIIKLIMPDSITKLAPASFKECTALKELVLSKAITVIEAEMFGDCTALETVELHEDITKIGYRAFYNCISVLEMKIPTTVRTIEAAAFTRCGGLPEVLELHEGLRDLDFGAFSYERIKVIVLPTTIANCTSFERWNCVLCSRAPENQYYPCAANITVWNYARSYKDANGDLYFVDIFGNETKYISRYAYE